MVDIDQAGCFFLLEIMRWSFHAGPKGGIVDQRLHLMRVGYFVLGTCGSNKLDAECVGEILNGIGMSHKRAFEALDLELSSSK